MLEQRNTHMDLLAILLGAVTVFVGLALFTYEPGDPVGESAQPFNQLYQADVLVYPQNDQVQNACGYLGAFTADVLYSGMGLTSFFVLAGMLALFVTLIYRQTIEALWSRSLGWGLAIIGGRR